MGLLEGIRLGQAVGWAASIQAMWGRRSECGVWPASDRLQPAAQAGHGGGHDANAIAQVAMSVLMELSVKDSMPVLRCPAVEDQLPQLFWRGQQAGEKQVGGSKELAPREPLAVTFTIQQVPIQA
jgi:hypothetical protein